MPPKKPSLKWKRLTELLLYEPRSGIFTWRVKRHSRKSGSVAGYSGLNPYVRIGIDGSTYLAHHLAWFYITKQWPSQEVDHENTIKNDNRWKNLRLATGTQNLGNMNPHRRNKTGYKGVSIRGKRFRAKILNEDLGYFNSAKQAALVYDAAARHRFGRFARTNF